MVNLNVPQGNYCIDCIWRWHSFFNDYTGQCAHIEFRNNRQWDYPQKKHEKYPYCTEINTCGKCKNFCKKKKWWKWRKLCY